jgi:hypothetical protein
MVLWLMLWNNTKDLPDDENTQLIQAIHDYSEGLLNSPTLQRRAKRMYEAVTDWMIEGRFTTRKSIFVLTQFISLLWQCGEIKIDQGSQYFKALTVVGALYDDHLEERVGQNYVKFERSGLKAVYDLGLIFQEQGYFPTLNFVKAEQ